MASFADNLTTLSRFIERLGAIKDTDCHIELVDWIEADRAVKELMAEQADRAGGEPVAWRYELAHVGWDKETYGHWNWHLSETKPHVPEGSIRNLTPLYAAPPSGNAGVRDHEH